MAMVNCPACNGTGKKVKSYETGAHAVMENCPLCNGSKQVDDARSTAYTNFLSGKSTGMAAIAEATPFTGDRTLTDAFRSSGQMVAGAMVSAAKAEVAGRVAQGMLAAAKNAAGDKWPAFLDTPLGQAGALLALPMATNLICETWGASIPHADKIRNASLLALQGVSQDVVHQAAGLIAPYFANVLQLTSGIMAELPAEATPAEEKK